MLYSWYLAKKPMYIFFCDKPRIFEVWQLINRPPCYRWGLTIDITSMNVLIISVGLCVDFCAHIVHGFLTGHGTKGNNLDQGTIRSRDGFSPQITNCLKNSDGLLQSATWWTTHCPPDFVWTSRGVLELGLTGLGLRDLGTGLHF